MYVLYMPRLLVLLVTFSIACNLHAQTRARLIGSVLVWTCDNQVVDTDLVRFKNQWIIACCESTHADHHEGVIRIVTSKDELSWELLASIESPTARKLLSNPRLSVQPNGQLMLTAVGIVANPQVAEPIPEFGGTVQTLAWFSVDGRSWSEARPFGSENTMHGKTVWLNELAYSYAQGSVCGDAQTVRILSSIEVGREMHQLYQGTFAQFFPSNASFVFAGAQGLCLMSRVGNGGELQSGMLGKSQAPFDHWDWTETDRSFSFPNAIKITDNRVLVLASLDGPKARRVLCNLDLETGKLFELLEIATNDMHTHAGISFHEGHLWISFAREHDHKKCVYLAKIYVE